MTIPQPQPATSDQGLREALDELAVVAEQTAQDQHRVAGKARTMARQRDRGWSWNKILERDPSPTLLELLASSVRRLTAVSGRFRPTLARALCQDGFSVRRIATRLGVSHQRISAMLNHRPNPAAAPSGPEMPSPAALEFLGPGAPA